MPTYRVCFDGEWQGDFDDREDALDWAREVGTTGRIVHVASFARGLRRVATAPKLVAVFPEDQAEEGRRLWKAREAGSSWAGGGTGAM
jgi:hypothetical protein